MKYPKTDNILPLLLWLLMVSPASGETVEIHFTEKDFKPAYLHVQKGDTLRFVNTDNLLHTVTSGKAPEAAAIFDSGYMTKGMVFEFKTTTPGVIDFFCVMHNDVMRGSVIVESPSTGDKQPD